MTYCCQWLYRLRQCRCNTADTETPVYSQCCLAAKWKWHFDIFSGKGHSYFRPNVTHNTDTSRLSLLVVSSWENNFQVLHDHLQVSPSNHAAVPPGAVRSSYSECQSPPPALCHSWGLTSACLSYAQLRTTQLCCLHPQNCGIICNRHFVIQRWHLHCSRLKTHLFGLAYGRALVTV